MPSKSRSSRSTFNSFKMKTLGAAVISALVLSNAYAAGLGKLTVLSSLGQPLRAEIELTSVSADEAGSLVPRLASADAFRQANIDLNPALLSLRFAVEQRGGAQYIRVTSTQPMNEPFVDMLLELGGSKGRLVREYTFLLDPPEMRNQQSAQVGATSTRSLPPQVSAPAPRQAAPVAEQPVREAPAPRPAPAPRAERVAAVPKPEAPAASGAADEYQVKKGDSLAKIAGQFRSEGVSLDQMLVALYRANPDAFVGKNMNRLRAGQILSVPAADDAQSVSKSEASGVVLAQAADFNSYRNKLAGQVATADAKQSDEGKQTSGGKITTKIQEQSAGNDSKDKLKLSKSAAGQANANNAVGASAEDLIAKDKAIAEANARVKELEKNVTDLQKLLEIKNRDLADQQKQAETAKTAAAAAPAAAPTPAPAPASTPVATVAPASSVAAEPVVAAAPASAVAAEPVSAVAETPVAPPIAKPKRTIVAPPPPPPEPSFLEDLTSNSMFLPGAAALLALLAGLGIYSARRRKQPTKSFEDSIITDSTLKSNSLFGSTGGQSVDTNNSVFNSNFVPSASQLDTNEVDPIAEADVYIAYGRDAQAEEILKEALRNQPDRHAVRVKLLEIYANRKDVRSFEILATELYGFTKGEGEDWQQAANMGAILDPSNPLYSSGGVSEDMASRVSALTAPTRPMDEQTMDALLETTHAKVVDTSDPIETSPYFGSTTLLADDALLTTPPQPTAEAESAVESKSEVEDLDFDLEGLELESADKKIEAELAQAELPADIASIDFDFLDKKPEAPIATAQPDADADLAGLSFDLNEEPVVPAPASAPEVLVPEVMSMDFPSSNAPAAFDAPAAASEKLPEFDLSGIELDLAPSAGTAPSAASADLPALEGLADEEPYTSNAEMATKLDLAIAYQEIGDKEGARELLEEVVKGGDPDQAEKAKNLLGKLA